MNTQAGITTKNIGQINNTQVTSYTITNSNNQSVTVINYGGIITHWNYVDTKKNNIDIIVGFTNVPDYQTHDFYCGGIIGRYANRIANGSFNLNNKTYTLAKNNNGNSLHGGLHGFNKKFWTVKILNQNTLELFYISVDGEEGFNGNLQVTVTYTFNNNNQLTINYKAITNKATPINLTNHAYFNLSGSTKNNIYNHKLFINADNILELTANQIPTGKLLNVANTNFDFTNMALIQPLNYDHNFVLNTNNEALKHAATAYCQASNLKLEVHTTEPGLQLYTGNFLDGSFYNKNGEAIKKHTAFCLETQHYPNAPNEPLFPNTILQPNQIFKSTTIYSLDTV